MPDLNDLLAAQKEFENLEEVYAATAVAFHTAVTHRADLLEQFARDGNTLDSLDIPKKLKESWQRIIDGRLAYDKKPASNA